jgi:glycosyltransferase involved in cell wall biosynthesis
VYVVPIHVPIMRGDSGPTVAVTWARSLELLRDSLGEKYGPLVVVAPWAENTNGEPLAAELSDIRLVPVRVAGETADFWRSGRRQWDAQVRELLERARVLHTTVGYAWRPFPLLAHRAATKAGVPTVFVQDGDKGAAIRQSGTRTAAAHACVYERMVRYGVRTASISMLKGPDLVGKYGHFGRNVLEILDASHSRSQVIESGHLESRLARKREALHLVFAGRLVALKRVDLALRLVAAVRRAGRPVQLAIYGDGPERLALATLAADLGLQGAIEFYGYMHYDELLVRLRSYDAQILPSALDETPRSVFDGYAAGLPLLAAPTPYTRTRERQDESVVLYQGESDAVRAIDDLVASLGSLSRAARSAGLENSAEQWYLRRAEATFSVIP